LVALIPENKQKIDKIRENFPFLVSILCHTYPGVSMNEKPYRPNVGMVVANLSGQVLVGERFQFPGAWQFPQGGIDEGEEPKTAALRELWEEVGIRDPELILEYPDWIAYDFPKDLELKGKLNRYRGQTQKWFLFFWDGRAEDCDLEVHEREFRSVRFMSWNEILASIVPFKKPVYEKLQECFEPEIDKKIRNYKNSGV
jgi:putative (di)nucleoside polyphosphate hydrolase